MEDDVLSLHRVLLALLPQLVGSLPPLARERALASLDVFASKARKGGRAAQVHEWELYFHDMLTVMTKGAKS